MKKELVIVAAAAALIFSGCSTEEMVSNAFGGNNGDGGSGSEVMEITTRGDLFSFILNEDGSTLGYMCGRDLDDFEKIQEPTGPNGSFSICADSGSGGDTFNVTTVGYLDDQTVLDVNGNYLGECVATEGGGFDRSGDTFASNGYLLGGCQVTP